MWAEKISRNSACFPAFADRRRACLSHRRKRRLVEAQRQVGSQGGVTGMPRPASDREAIEAEIAHVRSLGLDELHTLWRLTFRSAPPPAFTKDLMARFLCWDIQEQAFGGLDPETAKHLDSLAQGNKPGMDRRVELHHSPPCIWTMDSDAALGRWPPAPARGDIARRTSGYNRGRAWDLRRCHVSVSR
jgi:Protein of unknown function (DUF2924)